MLEPEERDVWEANLGVERCKVRCLGVLLVLSWLCYIAVELWGP